VPEMKLSLCYKLFENTIKMSISWPSSADFVIRASFSAQSAMGTVISLPRFGVCKLERIGLTY